MEKCNVEVVRLEKLRNDKLFEVGNWLHESVHISNDEVTIERHWCTIFLEEVAIHF